MKDLARAWSTARMKPISCSLEVEIVHLIHDLSHLSSTSHHPSVGVEGGWGQAGKESSWVGVELSP